MKRITGIVVLFFVICLAFQVSAADYPEFQGQMVEDFAGVLDDATKSKIEKSLRDFEKRTTNEIVVAIIPSLGEEDVDSYVVNLFKKWGIGKKGKDNGILLLLAIKEHSWRFEVGRGLEEKITDAKAGQIGRTNLVPYLKKGEFGKGIEESLSAAMNIISPKVLSPEERKQLAEKMKAERAAFLEQQRQEQERAEKLGRIVKPIAFGILICIVCLWVVLLVSKKIREAAARKKEIAEMQEEIRDSLDESVKEFDEIIRRVKDAESEIGSYPAWLQDYAKHMSEGVKYCYVLFEEAHGAVKNLPDDMKGLYDSSLIARKITEYVRDAKDGLKKLERIPVMAEEMRKSVKNDFARFERQIKETKELSDRMIKEGHRINPSDIINASNIALEAVRTRIAKDEDPTNIAEDIRSHAEALLVENNKLEAIIKAKLKVFESGKSLPAKVEKLRAAWKTAGNDLDTLKKNHAEDIWKNLSKEYSQVEQKLEIVNSNVAAAQELANMREQKFFEAAKLIGDAVKLATQIETLFGDIKAMIDKAEKAKVECPVMLKEAESAFSKAEAKVKHQDVDFSRKRSLKSVKDNIETAKKAVASSGIVNWIAVLALLMGVIADSKKIIRQAEDDITQAEAERKRKAVAAAAVIAAAAEAAEESRKSSNFSSFNSSNNDNGFSLGGGESGGGGASGTW